MATEETSSPPPPKERFNRLPDAERERLVSAIEQTPPQLFVQPFAVAVAQRAETDEKWVESLCFYLADWFAFLSENPDAYLERVVEILAEVPQEQNIAPQEMQTLRHQWRRIMQSDASIGVTLKALDILSRQANAYQRARSTTEVRPIYRTDPKLAPRDAILLHQLHITYRTEYGTQTVHIAMDGASIVSLINVLQRALVKEETLLDQKAYHYLGKVQDAK